MKTSSAVLSLLAASATYVAAAPAQPHDLAARVPKHGKHSQDNSTVVDGNSGDSQASNSASGSSGAGGLDGLVQEVRRLMFPI